jgi:phospholipase/lecithinase/hemolysin
MVRIIAALAILAAAAPAAGQVYVFGDSFVDAGNAYLGTLPFVPPLPAPAADPAQGYFQGRFGDGFTYADIISRRLTGSVTTPFLAGGSNFAVGGARAATDRVIPPFPGSIPSLPNQRLLYDSVTGGAVDPEGIYILSFGNNDVSALRSGDTSGLSPQQYGALYVANFVDAVVDLSAGGAKHIFVFGVPNPGQPEGVALQAALDAGLDAVAPGLTTPVTRFDYFSFFAQLQASPVSYGLTATPDFTSQCILTRPLVAGSRDCTGLLFFDDVHVTKAVQFEIARAALAQSGLGTVPEPASWAMLIAGFGLIGATQRLRRVGRLELVVK